MERTILSDFHRLKAFIPSATTNAITMPVLPPASPPMATKIAVSRASSMAVLAKFSGIKLSWFPAQPYHIKGGRKLRMVYGVSDGG